MVMVSVLVCAIAAAVACGGGPPAVDGLKDSFAQQLSANKFVEDFARNGDELTFTGPGAEGGTAKWRVQIDSAVVEENPDQADTRPFKGTVKSSWFSDGQPVVPSGRRSNLPIELTSNGLAQECFALWDKASERWGWE
jgi:hypothetical protein